MTPSRTDATYLAALDEATVKNDLKGVDRSDILDMSTIVVVLMLAGIALVSILAKWPDWVTLINVALLALVGFIIAYRVIKVRPDHLRAQQSDLILRIAREALTFMRKGLNPETADAVCHIILRNTTAAVAVAFTDRADVLGFAGVGSDHHSAGRSIVTTATKAAISQDISQVLTTKFEIGCPDPKCPLVAAIIVPLHAQGAVIGTLKFYYDTDRHLNETELAMAEGLAGLLSTQLEIHELEEQAALTTEMELKALQAQINPHFLFNTLNTISSFIRTDPTTARELLKKFATFYRHTLEHADEEVTLSDELEFLMQYFALEKARFGDRLNLETSIDEDLYNFAMPAFMIQPLVENSIGHAMREDGSPLHITITAHQDDDFVYVGVRDDGTGISEERLATIFDQHSGKGLGIALRNVRDRLIGVYGLKSTFKIESSEGVGTNAFFVIAKER